MEALIPAVALIAFGLMAARFGADSRPTIRSHEHWLPSSGVVWETPSHSPEPVAISATPPAAPARPPASHVVWTPVPAARPGGVASPFPTLQALDRARDPVQPAFASDPDAAFLEQRARRLIDQYWSERVWLTGLVDRARFDRVCDTLERDRQARREARQQVDVILGDHQSSIAS